MREIEREVQDTRNKNKNEMGGVGRFKGVKKKKDTKVPMSEDLIISGVQGCTERTMFFPDDFSLSLKIKV